MQIKKILTVVSDQIGTPTYTYDLAVLLVDMLESDKYGKYHVTNEGGYISWYDFAKEIFRQAGVNVEVVPVTAEAGFEDCKICGTNSLDEYVISSILDEGAKIDLFGVGEKLITAQSDPVFGGVYKLCAIEKEGKIIPKIKISNNTIKITNPGFKKVYRFYDKNTNKALADVITLNDEKFPENSYTIFDPANPWKKKILTNYTARPLQKLIFDNGNLVYNSPDLKSIANTTKQELDTLWTEIKRIKNPHKYYVDLSQNLWNLKNKLLENNKIE